MGIDLRELAILKVQAAHELLAEAHDCWSVPEAQQARDRVADAAIEMTALLEEQRRMEALRERLRNA